MALMDGKSKVGKEEMGEHGLPKGHWMHKALAKEKDRMAKKKSGGGAVKTPLARPEAMPVRGAPMQPVAKMPVMPGSGGGGI